MTSAASLLLSLLLCCAAHAQGWLGIYLDPTSDRPRVAEVIPDTPAARARLAAGDLLVAIDGKAVQDREAFATAIAARQAGDRIELTVDRGGNETKVAVRLGKRPAEGEIPTPQGETPPSEQPAQRGGRPAPQAETPAPPAEQPAPPAEQPVSPQRPRGQNREGRNAPPAGTAPREAAGRQDTAAANKPFLGVELAEVEGSVSVLRVVEGTPADKAGIRAGDRLVRWNETDVTSLEQVGKLLQKRTAGDTVALLLENGEGSRTVRVVLGSQQDDVAPRAVRTPERVAVPAEPEAPTAPSATAEPAAPRGRSGEVDALRAEVERLRAEVRELRQMVERLRREGGGSRE